MADQEVVIKISAKNLTAEEFAKARKEVAGLVDASKKGSGDSEMSWKKFGSSIKDVGETAFKATSLLATGIAALVAGVGALGARGSDIIDVRNQFDVLNKTIGNDSKQAIDTLDKALGGTIPKFELMKTVNAGLSQGLKVSIADYQTMGEVSRVLADRTGINNKEAFESLTRAMADGKDMMLKSIGMNIDAKVATENYARSIGKATADLNENEIKLAKRNAIMAEATRILKESGKSQDDFADSLASLRKRFTDFVDDLSAGIADSAVLGAALSGVGDVFKEVFGTDTTGLVKSLVHYIEIGAITMVEWGRTGLTAAGVLGRAWYGLQTIFSGTLSVVTSVSLAFANLVASAAEYATKLNLPIPGLAALTGAARSTRDEIAGMQQSFHDQAAEALEGVKGNSAFQKTLDGVDLALVGVRDRMTDAMAATNDHTAAIKGHTAAIVADNDVNGAQQKLLDDYAAKLRALMASLQLANKNGLGAAGLVDQYGKSIAEVLALAATVGKKVPQIVLDGFKTVNLQSLNELMSKEWDRILAENAAKAKQSQDVLNTGFVTNLQATIAAERSASDIHNKRSMSDLEFQQTIIKREAQDKQNALDEHAAGYAAAMTAIEHETDQKMHQAAVDYMDALDAMKDHTKDWSVMVNKWIGSVPDLLQKAFTGGGGIGGAMKALTSGIGGDSVSKLFGAGESGKFFGVPLTTVTNKLGNMFGATIGGALGTVLPGIGNVIGSLAGPLISKIGGFFKSIFGTAGRDAVRGFADSMGGFDDLHQRLAGLGAEGEKLWVGLTQGVGRGNAAQAKAEIERVTKALDAMDAKIKEARASEETLVGKLGDLATISPQVQAALNAVYDAKNPTDYLAAVQAVNGLLDADAQKQKEVDDLLKKYNLSWTELGKTAKEAKVAETTKGIAHEFDLLVGAGVDVNHVMEKMGPHVNDFIKEAQRAGVELPESFRRIIQVAMDSGQVLDANGKEIKDMSKLGLTFGETMQETTKSVATAVERLADVLEKTLGGAFERVGSQADHAFRDRTVHVTTEMGTSNNEEPPQFASEAFVRRPTLAIVGDTPGGEYILKPSTVKSWLNTHAAIGFEKGRQSAAAAAPPPVDLGPLEKQLAMLRRDMSGMAKQIARGVQAGMQT